MKKNKILLITAICLLVVISIVLVFVNKVQKRPFKNLEVTDIKSASVELFPPGETIQIAEFGELVKYLNDIVIYNEDNSYTEYNGQVVTFIITMTDGTQTTIMAYNPFLVIDGVGYKTPSVPYEDLNAYANRLLDDK